MDSNDSSMQPLFPDYDWCIDIEIYYASSDQSIAAGLLKRIHEYKKFSFRYNGILTSVLVSLGLTGSFLLLLQIYSSLIFSKRLAVHLGMICIWDSLYLLSCLATYGIPSLLYGMTPSYGVISYVLIVLQPFASFCVSCTIWQVVAITLERYWAVSKPLEQRTRKARFAVFWICLAIITGAFVLNLLPVPFERHLVPCFEVGKYSIRNHTLLKPYDDVNSRLYRFVVHFFPDLLFRAPCPIIIIAVLTVKTIQICNQRTVGDVQINAQMKRNIPLRLSLLNFKFVLCNSLYMFNTILIELLGYGESADASEEGTNERFMNSYYLTDASNLLLVVHSATNWLLFYHWPLSNKNRRKLGSVSLSSSMRLQSLNPRVAAFLVKKMASFKTNLGREIVTSLCVDYRELSILILGSEKSINGEVDQLFYHPKIQEKGQQMGMFIEQVLNWLSNHGRGDELRKLGRQLGEAHFRSNIHLTADDWKDIRSRVVDIIIKHSIREASYKSPYSTIEVHDTLTKAFNHLLSEMRSGTLCAAVDANRKSRSNSTCIFASSKEISRVPRSQSYVKVHLTVNRETSPFMHTSLVQL